MIKVSDWKTDLEYSKSDECELSALSIAHYELGYERVRFNYTNGDDHGIDFVATKPGIRHNVDIKARRRSCPGDIALETGSSSRNPGWLLKQGSLTTHLLFMWMTGDYYYVDYVLLRNAFIANLDKWKRMYFNPPQNTNNRYNSSCLYVPISVLRAVVPPIAYDINYIK